MSKETNGIPEPTPDIIEKVQSIKERLLKHKDASTMTDNERSEIQADINSLPLEGKLLLLDSMPGHFTAYREETYESNAEKIRLWMRGVTQVPAEIIVNAANEDLAEGGGVCGAIFREAGRHELTKACREIGHCDTGNAVITPAFNLNAKYIIHAVGPIWQGGNNKEPQKLYGCYKRSLQLAKEHQCHSIAFPLISSGIFGYPKDKAWRKAIQACKDFFEDNPDYELYVNFAILDDDVFEMGLQTIREVFA